MLAQKSNQQTQKKERRDDDDDFLTSGGPNQMIKVGHSRLTNPGERFRCPNGFTIPPDVAVNVAFTHDSQFPEEAIAPVELRGYNP